MPALPPEDSPGAPRIALIPVRLRAGGWLQGDPSWVGFVALIPFFVGLCLLSDWFRVERGGTPLINLSCAFLQVLMVMLGVRWWWRVGLLFLSVQILWGWWVGIPSEALWVDAMANLVCSVSGAGCARLLIRSHGDGDYKRLLITLGACVVVGPLVGLAFSQGLSSFVESDATYVPQVSAQFAGWVMGALILAPVPLAWTHSCQAEWRAQVGARKAEALLTGILTPVYGVVVAVFLLRSGGYGVPFMLIPIVYCAVRFDFVGAAYAGASSLFIALGACSLGLVKADAEALLRFQAMGAIIHGCGLVVAGLLENQRRAARQLMGLHDSTTELVASFEIIRDEQGTPCDMAILDVNPAFTLITAYTREQAIGARLSQLYMSGEPPHTQELAQMLKDGKPISFDTFLPKARRHLKVTAFPSDRRSRVSVVATDVTPLMERENEVRRANRSYAVLSQINQAVVRSKDQSTLLEQACAAFVNHQTATLCWAVWGDSSGAAPRVIAQAGEPADFPLSLEHGMAARRERLISEVCMAENRSIVCLNFALDPLARSWGVHASSLGFRSAAAFPLHRDDEVTGAVVLFSSESDAFSARELALFNSAAGELSHSIENLRVEASRQRAQLDLVQSERRFRQLFEQAPVAYVALDSMARVSDANPAWAELIGQLAGASIGRSFVEYVRPASKRSFSTQFTSLLQSGGDAALELELEVTDASVRSVILSLRVETDEQRHFKEAHGIVFNITDRKRYEDAVRVSEQRLTQAFEVANDGIWECTLPEKDLYLSSRFYSMLGIDPALRELSLSDWRTLVATEDQPAFDSTFNRFLNGGTAEFSIEYRMRGARNRLLWVMTRGRVVERDHENRPLRVLGTISDVTERRSAEEGLRETALKYRSYIDESPMAICLIAGDGLLLEINPAFRQLFGLADVAQEDLLLPELMEQVSHDPCVSFIAQLAAQRRGETELRGKRRRGGVLFLSLQGVQLAPARYLVFCVDSTARRRAEQALHARESMLESILHTALDGFWILDSRGALLEVNETYCSTSGYTHKELLQMRVFDIDAVESASGLEQHLARIRRIGADRWETAHRCKDGRAIDVEVSATYLPVEDGRFVVFIQNITDRKRAEVAMRQSQRQLSLIIEGSGLAAWDWDLKSGEVYFNAHWGRLFGYADAECSMKRQAWFDLIHPDDRGGVAESLARHLEGALPYFDCEYRVRRSDSQWLWIMDRGQVIAQDASGRPVRATGTQRDITARKIAQDRVREQAALLDQTRELIIAANVDGRVRLSNQSAAAFFDAPGTDLAGRPLYELLGDAEPPLGQAWLDALVREGKWEGELRFAPGLHQDKVLDCRCSVIRREDGSVGSLLFAATDVTDKRMLESRFLRSQRMESIGAIATGVAHDLNNIFLPISLAANMLRTSQDPAQRSSLHEMIDTSAQRGADVVNQLLTFGRGLDGRRAELQVGLIVQEIRRIVMETFPKNITADCRIASDLWTINADPTQMHQVLLNLCVNARDAMSSGGTLSLVAENVLFDEYYAAMNPEAEQGPYIVLQVGDTGCGISPENLEKIFDPFFTTKAPGSGTGLGLSTAHGIIKSFGGFIQVRSRLGQGSVFKVYLPAIPSPVGEVDETALDAPTLGNGELILVVDDEDAVRQSVKHLLEGNGYRCITAMDGRQGLVCYVQGKERIAAIITDIMMPTMDGAELIRAVRRIDQEVPILAMSGLPEKESASMDGAASSFLGKPFVSEQLLREVHRLLQLRPAISEVHDDKNPVVEEDQS